MPELPEVEVLARHLAPLLRGTTVRAVKVLRPKVIAPTAERELVRRLRGATFTGLRRRGKYLVFDLKRTKAGTFTCLGHLGMTGRMYLQRRQAPLPKHAAVVLDLGQLDFVYEDARAFGRFTLDTSAVESLGPEPLSDAFSIEGFAQGLRQSGQPIKVRLLDQRLVAGIGNIYASEVLFRAGISPRRATRSLKGDEVRRLRDAIRIVLQEAVDCGSTLPLEFSGGRPSDRLFYFGRDDDARGSHEERLRVYDRVGEPCTNCRQPIRRIVQAARSTFYCPKCQ